MSRRGLVLFAAMCLAWGIPYLLIRVAVAEMSPGVLVFARTGLAAAILLPVALLRADLRAVLRHWPWIVAFAVIEIAFPWVLLASAEQQISSSLAGLLIAGVPLVGAAIGTIVGGADRVGRRQLAGLLLGFAGVAVIAGGDFRADSAAALVQVAVVVVCYAVGPFILAHRLAGLSSVGVMAVSLGLSAVLVLPLALMDWPASPPSGAALASIVVLAAVCTAAAFLMFAALIVEVGPVRATVITYVSPAVAAVLGVLVLGETLTAAMLLGFGLAIAGSTLATRRPEMPDPEAAAIEVTEDRAGGAPPRLSGSEGARRPPGG